MSMPAFYLAPGDWGGALRLVGEEARHAHVLRLRQGERIMLLDGAGKSAICEIEKPGRREIGLRLLEAWQTPAPVSRAIIALALSKAVRRGFFLEKAAELGAWEIWLWQAQRSQGRLEQKLIAACEAQVRAGAKQCHNPWFPGIRSFATLPELLAASQAAQWKLLPWEEKAGLAMPGQGQLARPGATMFAIGPEGGIAADEADMFKDAGFEPVSLGERLLRCETAATLCLGLHWWAAQRALAAGGAMP